jgi:hypothetical protein
LEKLGKIESSKFLVFFESNILEQIVELHGITTRYVGEVEMVDLIDRKND